MKEEQKQMNAERGWLTIWEPVEKNLGMQGLAIVVNPGDVRQNGRRQVEPSRFAETEKHIHGFLLVRLRLGPCRPNHDRRRVASLRRSVCRTPALANHSNP